MPPHLLLTLQLLLCPFTPSASWAQQAPTPVAAREASQNLPAAKFIQDLGDDAIGVIKDKNLSEERQTAKYHDLLRNAFDMKAIAHFVIGRAAWNRASPEQLHEYVRLFEELVVELYGDRLEMYSGEKFRVTGARAESERDFMVRSEIDHMHGAVPTSVDWRVRQKDGRFAVVDVIVAGVSQSVTQREEYMSIIQRDDGRLDGLLARMRQRLQELNGAILAAPFPPRGANG